MAQRKRSGPRVRKAESAKPASEPKETEAKRPAKSSFWRKLFAQPGFAQIGKYLGYLVPRYFVNSWREVRQVAWPNRRETWRLTAAVFVFATIFGGMVAIVDHLLDAIFKKIILK